MLMRNTSDTLNWSPLWLIIPVAILVRVITWLQCPVVNPDSILYLVQAQNLTLGRFEQTIRCCYHYLPNYSIFVSLIHFFGGNWIVSGRMTSFIMGTAMVVPIYLLLRLFFSQRTSSIVAACYAVIPIFVTRSVDILRDPTCWFFISSGLYCYIYACRKNIKILPVSSFLFLMATWARPESIFFLLFCGLFIVIACNNNKAYGILYFWALPFFLLISTIFLSTLFSEIWPSHLTLISLKLHFHSVIYGIDNLTSEINRIASTENNFGVASFLREARSARLAVALWIILNRYFEAFTYPLFLLVISGIWVSLKQNKYRIWHIFSAILALGTTAIMFEQTKRTWVLEYRYTGIFILSCPLFMASGIELAMNKISTITRWRKTAYVTFIVLILASPLYKIFHHNNELDSNYISIGNTIAENADKFPVYTLSSPHSIRLVTLYSNLKSSEPTCQVDRRSYDAFIPSPINKLLTRLNKEKIEFILWEQNYWPKADRSFFKLLIKSRHIKKIANWHDNKAGEVVLFKLIQ